MKKRIVFITDCYDIAYNELRGVMLNNLSKPDDYFIEPVVPVKSFSIINGNFVLRLMAESYPPETIFSVILNPMKIRPARIIGKTKDKSFSFMGANTGVFDWFLRDFGIDEIYELHDPGFKPFGGKYVHAPAVAQIASGKPLSELGKPFDPQNLLPCNVQEGTIVHVDSFGLIKFLWSGDSYREGDELKVTVKGKNINAIYGNRMMSLETGVWVVYPGSSLGLFELGKVREDGAEILEVKEGDIINIEKRHTPSSQK